MIFKLKGLGKVSSIVIEKISNYSIALSGTLMFIVALITTYEVILRRIFDSPTTWVFAVSLFIMVWFVLLSAPFGLKEGRQITVDFIVVNFSERTKGALSILTHLVSLIFIITIGYYGLRMCTEAYTKGITSMGLLLYPQWLLYLCFPVTMGLYGLQAIKILIEETNKIRSGKLIRKIGWKDDPRFILPLFVSSIIIGILVMKISKAAGLIVLTLSLMLGGIPVFAALGCSGLAGLFFILGGFRSLPIVPVIIEETLHNFVLLAIPMFIMGGVILYKCGVGEKTYDFASKWLSGLPGGLGVGTVIACGLFSAMVGVSTAVAAAIGLVAIPSLIARGYTKELSYGCVAGGALGVLIPPSAGLIVYGFFTNSSVGTLFAAAFIPGFMIVTLFSIYVIFYCLISKKYEKVTVSWKERMLSLKGAIPGLLTPIFVLGGIYSGIFTPTEAAAVLVIYSMVVAFLYKKVSWGTFVDILRESATLGSMIMMIIVGAMVLANVIGHLRVARMLAEWLGTSGIPHWQVIGGLFILYIILGMFLDGLAITVLTIPVLYPLMPALGIDVIVFGVVLMMFVETALLTPPVGLNLFMVKAITGDTLWPIMKGNLPFAALLLIGAIILFLFPEIALWLPKILGV
jgi:tripartite ATP-independent transporter DctM subunit